MDIRRAALPLLVLLSLPMPSFASARTDADAALRDALGPKAVAALERRGLFITAGGPERVVAVSWEAFERHAEAAPRLAQFLSAFDELRKGRDPADPADGFADLAALPEGGLFTGALRDALAAAAARARAVRAVGGLRAPLAKFGSLYRTDWGRELARRTHSDLGGPALEAGVRGFFRDDLAAPGAPAAASAHLKAWAAAAGAEGLQAELETSLQAGEPSKSLFALLSSYLRDQALLEEVEAASERLARAERGSGAKALFDDARKAASALAGAPGLASRVKDLLAAPDPAGSVRVTAPELRIRPLGEPPLEPGDGAAISAAYWVDGAPAGRSTDVSELLVLDDEARGLSVVSRASRSRPSGGPYTVNVETVLPRSGTLAYRLILDAADAGPVELEAEAAVSDSLERLQAASAEARWLGLSCRFDDAQRAWDAVLAGAGSGPKKARALLAADARASLKTLAAWKERKKELDESLDGARLFATRENCDYRPDRAERALKLLADLPAGCDRAAARGGAADAPGVGAELAALAAVTNSRRSLQEAFRAGTARAKDREAACKSTEAADLYASALALLDSDSEARCGDFEREHAAIRLTDLPKAAAGKDLAEAAETELA
ncbi:MAG: hypothetical protein HYV15_07535, partial [Elusimicrobia bacterium]|nr:hypothetical protein [Elusimicrobiota bacterium]